MAWMQGMHAPAACSTHRLSCRGSLCGCTTCLCVYTKDLCDSKDTYNTGCSHVQMHGVLTLQTLFPPLGREEPYIYVHVCLYMFTDWRAKINECVPASTQCLCFFMVGAYVPKAMWGVGVAKMKFSPRGLALKMYFQIPYFSHGSFAVFCQMLIVLEQFTITCILPLLRGKTNGEWCFMMSDVAWKRDSFLWMTHSPITPKGKVKHRAACCSLTQQIEALFPCGTFFCPCFLKWMCCL